MTREQCVQKAKDIMINKNSYGIYHKYNFDTYNYGENTPINSDIILTAKWIKNSTNEPIYTVTFNMNDGSQNPTVRSQIIQENRNTVSVGRK